MPAHPFRKSTRLNGFNYAWAGGYFITLVTYKRQHLFGKIIDRNMVTGPVGAIVMDEWKNSGRLRQNIELDEWVIMPNHFHAIVFIKEYQHKDSIEKFQRTPGSLSALVAGFKSAVTRRILKLGNISIMPVWQRNYHDHIIRDEADLTRIREYIINNPLQWELDKEYSES